MNPARDAKQFGPWLEGKRRLLGLNEEQAARRLDVAVGTYLLWEVGRTPWAFLKADHKKAIRELFGDPERTPELEHLKSSEYRQAEFTAILPDIENAFAQEYLESYCAKCGSPIRIRDNGFCPVCGRPFDAGH